MKPIVYWLSGAAVSGILAVCVVAAERSDADDAGTAPLSATTLSATGTMPADGGTKKVTVDKLERSDEEWRKLLTPEQYRILRAKGTEAPGSGELLHNKDIGTYKCAGCGLALFQSDGKYESGCGWPSFFKPLEGAHITETEDKTLGSIRTEITCSRCGGHLGHVFQDGPAPTGIRYCVNSVSIAFDETDEKMADQKEGSDGSK